MRTLFIHGWLILPSGIQKKNLLMEDGIISALGEGTMDADEIVDVKGLYIAPGFIDIHLHGAGGHDFMEGSVEAFQAISDYHLFRGTTGIVPTAVSASLAGQIRFLDGYRKAQDSGLIRSRLLGAHLEGPYLSTVKSGAHDVQYLKNPDPNEYERLISDYPFIKRFTIAPELKGAMAMGRTLHDHGINASIGHSDAHGKEIAEAERNGFTSVTHLYNAMSSQGTYNGQKAAGVAEMALLLKNLYVELIADLKHVPPELILLTYQAKTADKMILVTDCLSPAGMKEGPFFIGEKTAGM
jgi:N-acetylglucosamine-6-phosphate deacetylase